jgi:PPM family protein phosphatase
MPFQFSIAYFTNKGKVRPHNEDALLVGSPVCDFSMPEPASNEFSTLEHLVLAVADGIGGANAGEVASRVVVEGLQNLSDLDPDAIAAKLQEINRQIYSMSQEDERLAGMGSTVAGIAFSEGRALILHVGDCRVYRIKDGFFQQLTEDDTTAQILVRAGKLDADEIRGENQHGLLQALGGHSNFSPITPHVRSLDLKSEERFMICSDGLTDFLGLDDLEEVVRPEHDVQTSAQRLVEASAGTPQKDNVSFILVDSIDLK